LSHSVTPTILFSNPSAWRYLVALGAALTTLLGATEMFTIRPASSTTVIPKDKTVRTIKKSNVNLRVLPLFSNFTIQNPLLFYKNLWPSPGIVVDGNLPIA